MPQMKYALLQNGDRLEFVEMPATHMYQLTALNRRLHKEVEKLTAEQIPSLPHVIAEFENLELVKADYSVIGGLDYINTLEQTFAAVNEEIYPLVSLLTEIRALQAQLEQWYEEEMEA
ncbi:hydrolase/acyltransferase [Paenibacillus sp. KN14-4R]|uniref:hydrolase/acyltransferase n=1 Tax=Paenibacillus sp. KN14-4R TaxID=3445773 RepID=UPI003F9FBB1D